KIDTKKDLQMLNSDDNKSNECDNEKIGKNKDSLESTLTAEELNSSFTNTVRSLSIKASKQRSGYFLKQSLQQNSKVSAAMALFDTDPEEIIRAVKSFKSLNSDIYGLS
ncbi:hypothetical protein HHI36_012103, partial [Cryptolaemus montrouzieri]